MHDHLRLSLRDGLRDSARIESISHHRLRAESAHQIPLRLAPRHPSNLVSPLHELWHQHPLHHPSRRRDRSSERYSAHMSAILLTRMDLARPYTALSPTLEGDVLAVLVKTTRGLTGREVARLVRRGSQRGVLAALERLVNHGLVAREEAGPSFQYTLNREHLAAPAVEALAGMRAALWARLRSLVAAWSPAATHASVFGSAARAEGDTTSDIDILIVRPEGLDPEDPRWRTQIADLAEQVRLWTGNHAGISEVGAGDLSRLTQQQPALAENLRADAVTLLGPAVAELVEGQ